MFCLPDFVFIVLFDLLFRVFCTAVSFLALPYGVIKCSYFVDSWSTLCTEKNRTSKIITITYAIICTF